MVADFVLAEGSCGELVRSVIVCCVATTLMVVLPVTEPEVAVIVMTDPAVAPLADKAAVMVPFALVLVVAPERVPPLADSVTGIALSALLLASFANTVIEAMLLPSDGMDVTLVETVSDATVLVVATVTVVFPDTVPALAVTVIAVPVATPEAVSEVVA
jgi:hypothetical protein